MDDTLFVERLRACQVLAEGGCRDAAERALAGLLAETVAQDAKKPLPPALAPSLAFLSCLLSALVLALAGSVYVAMEARTTQYDKALEVVLQSTQEARRGVAQLAALTRKLAANSPGAIAAKQQLQARNIPVDYSSLATAVHQGDMATARLLLDAELDINALDPQGRTLLMMAATAGDGPSVQRLLELRADPLVKSLDGRSVLDMDLPEAIRQAFPQLTKPNP